MAIDKKIKENLFGTSNYSSIVSEIVEKIQKANADTLAGSELLKDVYVKLNESKTPIFELRQFTTGAEKIAGDDVKLKDILDFITKKVTTNGDLNFLINICKEEHYIEMSRLNHPSPESTIKEIKEEFDKPSSVIEEGIKSGIFDSLKSNLLPKIKESLKISTKKLNENSDILFSNNLVKYSPIGIKFEDIENNRLLMLTESEILSLDRETKEFKKINENINIPENYGKLMNAINSCKFSPENNSFSLNENWDFSLNLLSTGEVTINGKSMDKSKLKDLLLESVKVYVGNPLKVENFNKMNFLHDADNFIALVENHKHLIKLDTLEVIKNLNENSYIIFDKTGIHNTNTPAILSSSVGINNKLFESYSALLEVSNDILKQPINDLFESQLKNEFQLLNERNEKIVELNEEQKDLNEYITKVRNLKAIAEENSPAMEQLNSQENQLIQKLNENIDNLNFYKNNFKL